MSVPARSPSVCHRSFTFAAWRVGLLVFGLCAGAFLGACAGEPPKAKPVAEGSSRPQGAAIRFADVKPILDASCAAGCHGPNGSQSGVPFDDLNRVKLVRAEMHRRLTSEDPNVVMPKGNTSFKSTEDGKFLIEWLQQGSDVRTEESLMSSDEGVQSDEFLGTGQSLPGEPLAQPSPGATSEPIIP